MYTLPKNSCLCKKRSFSGQIGEFQSISYMCIYIYGIFIFLDIHRSDIYIYLNRYKYKYTYRYLYPP